MNNIQHQLAVQEAVKGKFKGSQHLRSKVVPMFPSSAEREFQRVANAYMRIVHKTLKEHLPAIMAAYQHKEYGDSRYDDKTDISGKIDSEFHDIAKQLESRLSDFSLEKFLEKIGNMSKEAALREWKRIVKNTLGIDLLDDYYKGDFYAQQLRIWVDENVQKIKSIPNEALAEMKDVVLEGYLNGKSVRAIQKDIQERYNVSKSKAKAIARDQLGTLNAQITRLQQKDAGCSKYRWSDSHDSRVRDCHHALNGKTFSWDDPPEMWYISKKQGKVYTGRRCHPGEDFGCRCVAIPVFDIETLNVPMKELGG